MANDDDVMDAALHVFEQVGFRAATTRRIAEEAGINEVTLFRRYGSKDQLLVEAMRRHQERLEPLRLPEEPGEPRRELTAWAEAHLTELFRQRVLIRTTMCELEAHPSVCRPPHEGPAKLANDLARYLERLRATGRAAGDWDATTAAWMLMGTLFSEAMGQDLPGRPRLTPADAAARYTSLFLRAVGAEQNP